MIKMLSYHTGYIRNPRFKIVSESLLIGKSYLALAPHYKSDGNAVDIRAMKNRKAREVYFAMDYSEMYVVDDDLSIVVLDVMVMVSVDEEEIYMWQMYDDISFAAWYLAKEL